MTFWHANRPKHTSTLLTHDITLPLIEHNSGNSCCRTHVIKHNSGNTHCAVGKKIGSSWFTLKRCHFSQSIWQILCTLTLHPLCLQCDIFCATRFFYTPFLMWVIKQLSDIVPIAQLQKDKKMLVCWFLLELLLTFFVDWDEDGKRPSLSKLVYNLTDVNYLDELSLNNNEEVLLVSKDKVLLDDKDEVASCNWTIIGGCLCLVWTITSSFLQRLL